VRKQTKNTFVLSDPSEILEALVGLKDVRVLHYERAGPDVSLVIEQVLDDVACPSCGQRAKVKERPVVSYVDLPVYGFPMRLTWKKHRMKCVNEDCAKGTWVLRDHRIAAKDCLLTTRAAKWATRQVGYGRSVKEVAQELGCDWHTVNSAVTSYGAALLAADRQRVVHTSAVGLDETNFVRLNGQHTSYATTVCDVEHHRVIDIVPTRRFEVVAGFLDQQPNHWKAGITVGTLDMSDAYAAVYSVVLPQATQVVDPFHVVSWPTWPSTPCADASRSNSSDTAAGATTRSTGPGDSCCAARSDSTTPGPRDCATCSTSGIPRPRWRSPIG
jgi:transposase